MMICSDCAAPLKDGAKFCGVCGAQTTANLPATPSRGPAAAAAPARILAPTPEARLAPLETKPMPATLAPPPTLAHTYECIRLGEYDQAASELLRWWHSLHWAIRVAAITVLLALVCIGLFSTLARDLREGGLVMLALLLVPLSAGAIIALAQPEPMLAVMAGFASWTAMKRDRARDKGTFLARWFFRPFYGALSGSAQLTGFIHPPYLRAGATVALQGFAFYLALLVAYVAIALLVAIVFIMIALWLFSLMLSQGSSSGSSRSTSRILTRAVARRSERRTDLFGNSYVQHLDEAGRPVGTTRERTDWLGNAYQQHEDQAGKQTGHSQQRNDLFGNAYQQHYTEESKEAGYSENRQDLLGNPYVQHKDEQGHKTGRSEAREDWLGKPYVKHEGE